MKTMMSVDCKKIVRISDEKSSKLYEEGLDYPEDGSVNNSHYYKIKK